LTTLRRAACIAVVCLLAAPATALADAKQDALVAAVNYSRASHGLGPLAPSKPLMRSSRALARGLMRLNVFAHPGSINAGGGFRSLGEALSLHRGKNPRYAATVRSWLASPAHRGLVLNPGYTHAGAGIARGVFGGYASTIWVLHVGAH
jgi:uncharacterized protein YkwD